MTIYKRIQELAKQKGMSIRQLESALGFSNGTLNKWKVNAPTDKLTRVANYLSVDPADLIFGSPSKENVDSASEKILDRIGKNLVEQLVQLDDLHKQRVFAYTQAQVEDQNRFDQPDTLAAHQADPNHHIDAKEAKKIANTLDDIIDKYEDKKK